MRAFKPVLVLTILLLGALSNSMAQLSDSLEKYLSKDPDLMFKFDSRHSFITSRHAKIFGFKFGLDHSDRVQYGGGLNVLLGNNEFSKEFQVNDKNAGDTLIDANLDFWFFSPYFEYTFFHTEHWEVTIPVQVGIGKTQYSYTSSTGAEKNLREGLVFTYEPAMTVQYKFWRYFGIGTGVGYRLMLIPNSKVEESFTSPIYIFRFKVFFGRIYRDIFPKKE